MSEKTAAELLEEAGNTYLERNSVYGNNYKNVGKAIAAFFPDGVVLKTPEDHERFHIFNLIMVKLSRYCVNWKVGGHQDSIHDAMVYCAILEEIDEFWRQEKSKDFIPRDMFPEFQRSQEFSNLPGRNPEKEK